MQRKPKILISNDDGIHAPGIRHLWHALKDEADLVIAAPATEQSAVSMSITLREPLRVRKVEGFENTPAWSVSGTPADCIKMALSVLMDSPPDLVVSGINAGTNAGRNILYSGTIACTIEAVQHDIPGVAFSCLDYKQPDFLTAKKYVSSIIQYVMSHPLPYGTLLNVNFPSKVHQEPKGIKLTRQGKGCLMENPDKRSHPVEGHEYYWLGCRLTEHDENAESDMYWLERGYVTAVPLQVGDLTDWQHFNSRKQHFDDHFSV